MSLGLLAKDSVQDLTSLGGGPRTQQTIKRNPISSRHESFDYYKDRTTDGQNHNNRRILGSSSSHGYESTATSSRYDDNNATTSFVRTPQQEQQQQGSISSGEGGYHANPQQAPITSPLSVPAPSPPVPSTYYTAFHYDMSEYSGYYNDDQQQQQQSKYLPSHQLAQNDNSINAVSSTYLDKPASISQQLPSLWCCLFPWLFNNRDSPRLPPTSLLENSDHPSDEEDATAAVSLISPASCSADSDEVDQETKSTNMLQQQHPEGSEVLPDSPQHQYEDGSVTNDSTGDGDSTNSNNLGEKLSERERQAVLARLRLAQPEQTTSSSRETAASSNGFDVGRGGGGGELDSVLGVAAEASLASARNHGHVHSSQVPVSPSNQKGLLMNIPQVDDNSPKRSILKKRSMNSLDTIIIMKNGEIMNNNVGGDKNTSNTTVKVGKDELSGTNTPPTRATPSQPQARRRALFPSYGKTTGRKSKDLIKPVRFAPMARVVSITSRTDMSPEEKADIWWQRPDYEAFRRAGRIITRAMLEGGSEIWLGSSSSSASSSAHTKANKSNGKDDDKDKGGSNNGTAACGGSDKDKWWHKFGHSRRGLEHVVSIEEGKQRQLNVKTSIRAVLDELSKQKMYRRMSATNNKTALPSSASNLGLGEKLRNVSLQHTLWARDLALAAGASDADAVESSFAEDRRSREFYLLKLAKNKSTSSSYANLLDQSGKHLIPQFMQPSMVQAGMANNADAARNKSLFQQKLDANTKAQVRIRSAADAAGTTANNKVKAVVKQSSITSATLTGKDGDISCEPIHDPDSTIQVLVTATMEDDNGKKLLPLARKAAGFSADEDEKVNMAAVLSGMGVFVKNDTRSEEKEM